MHRRRVGWSRCSALATAILASAACAAEARAADLHVDGRHTGAADGTAARPFRTIGAAVAAAAAGDRIKVARGTYAESVATTVNDLTLEGGYVGASSDVYASGGTGDFASADTMDPQTIVASSAGDAVFSFVDAGATTLSGLIIRDGARHGVLADGDPPSAHRLTVTRCTIEGNGVSSENGGGIYADVPLVVRETIVRDNVGERGAGIAADGGALTLEVSLIENNIAYGDHGGGVYAHGDVHVIGNVIRGNRAGEAGSYGWGGGLLVYGGNTVAELRGNVISGNHAPTKGSGVFVDDGAVATLVNELIVDNLCPSGAGAGLYVDGLNTTGSTATLTNVTIAGHACSGGNAVLLERYSTATINSSIIWGNGGSSFAVDPGSSLTVRYSDVEGGHAGEGNVQVDPAFADPAAGDYHLRSTSGRPANGGECVLDGSASPAIDAGDPALAYSAEPDPNGGRVDMGAYGNTAQAGCTAGGGSTSVVASAAATTGGGGSGGDGGAAASTGQGVTTGAGGETSSGEGGATGEGGRVGQGGANSQGSGGEEQPASDGSGGDSSSDGPSAGTVSIEPTDSTGGCGVAPGGGEVESSSAGGGDDDDDDDGVTSSTGHGGSDDGDGDGDEDGDDGSSDARTGCAVGLPRGGAAPMLLLLAAAAVVARRRRSP